MTDPPDRLKKALADRYAIKRELGSGGMATVYLAEDLKHNRKVAVKVLRPELAAVLGAERFLKEIEVTANLQHPHILALFDSGEAGSFLYYVMPYVEGESLRQKLNREKQLAIEEAVQISEAAASALDYAHRHDVIHRDIKPENILLHEGQALVADFGIALALRAAGGDRLTETGLSLGTPQYMSPEQATADRELDARSDIYSLGCVLYEMLVGDPPHTASTAQAVIAKVITDEPRPVTAARKLVPGHVEYAVHKALAKLPADRFASASQFAEALTNPSAAVVSPVAAALPPGATAVVRLTVRYRWLGWAIPLSLAVLTVIASVAGWGWMRSHISTAGSVMRFRVSLAPGHTLTGFRADPMAISPDGTRLVYVANNNSGRSHLYLRVLSEFETTAIPGTEGAGGPFFSADGQWVGFFVIDELALKKVSLTGGRPIKLCDLDGGSRGAAWGPDDMITFALITHPGLYRISADGGTPEELTAPDSDAGERSHGWPQLLPDDRGVLFTVNNNEQVSHAAVLSLQTREWRTVLRGGGPVRYLPTGHLVYAESGVLVAVSFNLGRLEALGARIAVLDGVSMFGQGANFSVSQTGSLIYATASAAAGDTLVWVDREGRAEPLSAPTGRYGTPRLSPNGRRIAFTVHPEGRGDLDIWIHDLERGVSTRLTTEPGMWPVWTPDGTRVTFASDRSGTYNVYWKRWDGTGVAEALLRGDNARFPLSWSPDGRTLAFYELNPELDPSTGRDIWVLRLGEDSLPGSPSPIVATRSGEWAPMLSPNGRWLAYLSDESGRIQVYVRPYPGPGPVVQISVDGGSEPVWAPEGRELFYRNGDRMMTVTLETEQALAVGATRLLFEGRYKEDFFGNPNYDVSPDGQRFLMLKSAQESAPSELRLVLNWFQELKEKVRN
jgi:serine/threonine-protein kinase